MHTHMSLLHANHMLDRRLASFSSVSIGFLRLATRNSTPMHPSQHLCTHHNTYAPITTPMHLKSCCSHLCTHHNTYAPITTPMHLKSCCSHQCTMNTDAPCTIMLVFVLVLALLLMLKSNLIYFTERGICLAF